MVLYNDRVIITYHITTNNVNDKSDTTGSKKIMVITVILNKNIINRTVEIIMYKIRYL